MHAETHHHCRKREIDLCAELENFPVQAGKTFATEHELNPGMSPKASEKTDCYVLSHFSFKVLFCQKRKEQ